MFHHILFFPGIYLFFLYTNLLSNLMILFSISSLLFVPFLPILDILLQFS